MLPVYDNFSSYVDCCGVCQPYNKYLHNNYIFTAIFILIVALFKSITGRRYNECFRFCTDAK